MDLNVRQMRAFVSVARLGSFTRAAALLHLSQPALTVQLRKLEETLGSRLLDRNSRGVELTRIGRELLPLLARTVQDMDTLLHDARELGGARGGTVRLAVLPAFSASLLPDIILNSRQADPLLQFVIRDAVASTVNQLVRSEEVDFGLTGGNVDDSELEIVQASHERLSLVFPADHAIAAKRRVTGRDLVRLPFVLTARGTSVRAVVDAAFEKLGHEPLLTCEPTYMMTAVAMVRAGLGLTILPSLAREVHAEPSLRARPIDDANFVRAVALIKKKGRTLPPAAAAFLAVMAQALATTAPGPAAAARRG